MFQIQESFSFTAGHKEFGFNGTCSLVHGHTWIVTIRAVSPTLDQQQNMVDYGAFRDSIREEILKLDHTYLNTIPEFQYQNSTPERLALYIYKHLTQILNNENLKIVRVDIRENENSIVSYYE